MGLFSSIGNKLGGMAGKASTYAGPAMGKVSGLMRSSGMGGAAARGAAMGLGASMVGGMFMSGDQSQIGGALGGAAIGALGARYGARGLKAMRSAYSEHMPGVMGRISSNRFVGTGTQGSLAGAMINRGIVGGGNILANKSFGKHGLTAGVAAGGLIGSTMLESNRGY